MQKCKYLGHQGRRGEEKRGEEDRRGGGKRRGHLAPGEHTHTCTHAGTRAHLQFRFNSLIAHMHTDGQTDRETQEPSEVQQGFERPNQVSAA